jgi:hypothetical protein
MAGIGHQASPTSARSGMAGIAHHRARRGPWGARRPTNALLLLLLSCWIYGAAAVPFSSFISTAGGSSVDRGDDTSVLNIVLPTPFYFYETPYSSVSVMNNGIVSFDGEVTEFTPSRIPQAGKPIVAA